MSFTITIDGHEVSAEPKETLLDVCRRENVWLPTLCAVDGLTEVGACRLCLLEVEGTTKLLPACTTPAVPYQKVRTDSDTLRNYRRMILELFFSERNHMCGVCVANNHCELQALAVKTGIDHFRFPFLQPPVGWTRHTKILCWIKTVAFSVPGVCACATKLKRPTCGTSWAAGWKAD